MFVFQNSTRPTQNTMHGMRNSTASVHYPRTDDRINNPLSVENIMRDYRSNPGSVQVIMAGNRGYPTIFKTFFPLFCTCKKCVITIILDNNFYNFYKINTEVNVVLTLLINSIASVNVGLAGPLSYLYIHLFNT